ncbi:hypothetical protein WT72_24230 [Burkholderia pseudomultivorans]|uniref:hypothetical protein n=1 Tax=Burkholderia pseudomultivorans TaxID=1207504 RepID=UPI0007564DF5|nr:hypothetical protein [Burkholderia pseudomultivorans]KWI50283.1 hypothetical protein WT72_24230 [Burkholderia pseudomultivorans]
MNEIKVSVTRTNTTTHRAVLDSGAIKRALARRVCESAWLDQSGPGVSVDVRLSSRMGSYGAEYEAGVTVTVDHEKQPEAGEA